MYKGGFKHVEVSLQIILSSALPFGLWLWTGAHVYLCVYVYMGVHVNVCPYIEFVCVLISHSCAQECSEKLSPGGRWCTLPASFTSRVNFHAFDYLEFQHSQSQQKHTPIEIMAECSINMFQQHARLQASHRHLSHNWLTINKAFQSAVGGAASQHCEVYRASLLMQRFMMQLWTVLRFMGKALLMSGE